MTIYCGVHPSFSQRFVIRSFFRILKAKFFGEMGVKKEKFAYEWKKRSPHQEIPRLFNQPK